MPLLSHLTSQSTTQIHTKQDIQNTLLLKKVRQYVPEVCLLALIATAVIIRFMLIRLNWPVTNSDEATMDLMALHIAYHGEHPIFFYGQGYMGTTEAYLGALLFQFFGVSVFTVRLGLLLIFALYLLCTYLLTSLLYSRPFALVVVALLCVTSPTVFIIQLFATGGYNELMIVGPLIFLLASHLAFSSHLTNQERSVQQRRRRTLIYTLLGLLAGLGLWTHPVILPCILAAGILLCLFCRHEFRTRRGLFCLLGFLLGILPIIVYNLSAPPELDTIHALVGSTGYTVSRNHITLLQQIMQAIVISLPVVMGVNSNCPVKEPLHPVSSPVQLFATSNSQQCLFYQGSWGLGIITLWIIATTLTVLPIWWQWRRVKRQIWSVEERREAIHHMARLMLLVSAAISFALFAISMPAALYPRADARYIYCLPWLAFPALLWPLWNGFHTCLGPTKATLHGLKGVALLALRLGILLVIAATFVGGTLNAFHAAQAAQKDYDQRALLIEHLEHRDATRIYSDYWTCNWLIFQSHEKVTCASLDDHLKTGVDRYLPYRALVHAAPQPAYVFKLGSPQAQLLGQKMSALVQSYHRSVLSGYVVYSAG